MKYQAFLGTFEFTYSDEWDELYNKTSSFFKSIDDLSEPSVKTFKIDSIMIGDIPMFYAFVEFPSWAEALFLIQFYEYCWKILEES